MGEDKAISICRCHEESLQIVHIKSAALSGREGYINDLPFVYRGRLADGEYGALINGLLFK